jgi:nucleotide-binding universal stress UspA family protein
MAREAKGQAAAYLRSRAEQLRQLGARADAKVVIGSAAETILEITQQGQFGLVALSSKGRGGSAWALGSVAGRVIHEARIPVLLIPASGPPHPGDGLLRSIIVPLDGSNTAKLAVPLAQEAAEALHADVHFVQAVPTPQQIMKAIAWGGMEIEFSPPLDQDELVETGLAYLKKAAEPLAKAGIETRADVLVGAAVESIAEYAQKTLGSLLIFTTAGATGASFRWRIGSVANGLLRQARVPIILAPPRPMRPRRKAA